jgi:hypothetical protein
VDGYILSQNELGSVDVLRRNKLTFGFEDMVEYPGPWNRPLGLTRGSLQTFEKIERYLPLMGVHCRRSSHIQTLSR